MTARHTSSTLPSPLMLQQLRVPCAQKANKQESKNFLRKIKRILGWPVILHLSKRQTNNGKCHYPYTQSHPIHKMSCLAWYLTSDVTTRIFFQTGRLLTVSYMTSISSFLVEIKELEFSLKSGLVMACHTPPLKV